MNWRIKWRWVIMTLLVMVFIAPVYYIIYTALNPTENIWSHLVETLLLDFVTNSLTLMFGTGLLALIFGVCSAWIVTAYDFPTRRYLLWALLLPFSVPAYINAYVYTDLLEYAGPIQKYLRHFFEWKNKSEYWFPETRNLGGAIIFLALVLYPYIFLMARKAFLEQSISIKRSAEILGCSKFKIFFKIFLPLARPAIMVGLFLVMMETLSDFGTVEFFAINTLSLGAYNVWINMGNIGGAAQIALLTLSLVFLMVFVERIQRQRQKQIETNPLARERQSLYGLKKILALIFTWSLVLFGFAIPVLVLIQYTIEEWSKSTQSFSIIGWEYLALAKNSLMIATLGSLITVIMAFLMVKFIISEKNPKMKLLIPIFSLGYALPGTILGIGSLAAMVYISQYFSSYQMISSSLTVVIYAYVIRFLTIPIGAIDTGYGKISKNIHSSAILLSRNQWQPLFEIDIPLIKKSLLTGGLIVFVDIMKELPLMIILRPLNYETLATQVYNYASDSSLEKAALSALTIVLVGIIPVILLTKSIDHFKIKNLNKTTMLKIKSLSVEYSTKQKRSVLVDFNLKIKKCKIVTLLGPSGCGKSTLLSSIAGFTPIKHGEIFIDHQLVSSANTHVPSQARGIGMVFQDHALFPHLTVHENILFALNALGKKINKDRIDFLIHQFQLESLLPHYPHEISGGQQQRVALARSIAPKPKFILMDEPFASQDVELKELVMDSLIQTIRQDNMTALIVTHDQMEAFSISDKMGIMKEQSLEQFDKPHKIYHHPATPFVADFIGNGAFINSVYSNKKVMAGPLNFEKFSCRKKHQSKNELEEGKKVRVFLRPDQVAIKKLKYALKEVSPPSKKDKKSNQTKDTHELLDGYLKGTIISSKFRGSSYLYKVKLDKDEWANNLPAPEIMSVMSSFHRYKVGKKVAVMINKEEIVVFSN